MRRARPAWHYARPILIMLIAALLAVDYGAFSPVAASPVLQAVTLTLTPTDAVPGETVTLNGSGFSTAFIPGGPGPNGVHHRLPGSAA